MLLSLFDYSGVWSKPYRDAGVSVLQVDLRLGIDIYSLSDDYLLSLGVRGILAAPPCTHFALSGRAHFKRKDESGVTAADLSLISRLLYIIELVKPEFYAIEQPMTRLHKLIDIGPIQYKFHPYEFAGYSDDSEAYKKLTWLFGNFNTNLIKKPVEPVLGSMMQTRYGGNNKNRQDMRSKTPYGFSLAFYEANNFQSTVEAFNLQLNACR